MCSLEGAVHVTKRTDTTFNQLHQHVPHDGPALHLLVSHHPQPHTYLNTHTREVRGKMSLEKRTHRKKPEADCDVCDVCDE